MRMYFLASEIALRLWSFAALYAAVYGVEKILPAERNQSLHVTMMNIKLSTTYVIATVVLMTFIAPELSSTAHALASHWPRIRLADDYVGSIAQILSYILVFDFIYYWFHRAQHKWTVLWQVHKLHHAIPAMNVTASTVHHWLEEPLRAVFIYFPMSLIFELRTPEVVAVGIILGVWGSFDHWNIRLPLGKLTCVLTGPQLHRIHHSNRLEHADKNFASFFPIWDILFSTYCAPRNGEYPTTGLDSGEVPRNVLHGSVWPFVGWWKMLTLPTAEGTQS